MNSNSLRTPASMDRKALLLSTALAGSICMALSAPASAQQTAAAAEVEEIVVTGTLIRGIAPVGANTVSITREDIVQSGTTDANQLLGTLPQSNFFMAFPQPGGNVSAGVGRVPINFPNLRNLPSGSTGNPVTLVMMDGHRIVPSGIEQSGVDSGIIPPGVIERVETILDGASAMYGSDAVGGVINYQMRKRFDETKADAQYGFADEYYSVGANLTSGKTWDGGGLGATYSFGKSSDLRNGDRPYAIARNFLLPGAPLTGTACEDHSTVTTGGQTFTVSPGSTTFTPGTVNCASNAFQSFIAAQERHAGFVTLSQDLSDTIKFDVTAMYTQRKAKQNFGPFTTTQTIRPANPYFRTIAGATAAQNASHSVSFSYGPVLGTSAQEFVTSTRVWQVTPTLTVDVGEWQIRGLVAHGKSRVGIDSAGINSTLVATAIGGTTLTTAINPYDIASANQALVRSLVFNNHSHADQSFTQLRAIGDGPLFSIPGGEVKAALGAEWTKTGYSRVNTNAATGQANAPLTASTTPYAFFGELQVPIVSRANRMPGIESLTLSISGRFDDYKQFGTTFNPKFAATYEPVEWFTLKGNWNKSFRAPTVNDIVAARANTFSCVGNVPGCIQGFFQVPPEITTLPVNPIFMYLNGARPDLEPEKSTNWSIGADIRPPIVPNLLISASYYKINYTNQISLPTSGVTLNPIFANAKHLYFINPTAAQLDAVAAGTINGVVNLASARANGYNIIYYLDGRTTNLGGAIVGGLDLTMRYNLPTSFGSINASVNGNWQLQNDTQFFKGGAFVDTLATGGSTFSLTAQVGINIGEFRAQATLQHRAGYAVSPGATRVATQTGIDQFDLVNTSFRYNVKGNTPLLQDLTVTLTINNIFDAEPPPSYTTSGGTANGQTIGRFVQIGLAKRF